MDYENILTMKISRFTVNDFTVLLLVWLLFSIVHSFSFAQFMQFFCCCYALVRYSSIVYKCEMS